MFEKDSTRDSKPKAIFSSWDYGHGSKIIEHDEINNAFLNAIENFLLNNPCEVIWAGEYTFDLEKYRINYPDKFIKTGNTQKLPKGLYVVNHYKKEFYSREKTILKCTWDKRIEKLDPLPHLTNSESWPRWANNLIELTSQEPQGYKDISKEIVEEYSR